MASGKDITGYTVSGVAPYEDPSEGANVVVGGIGVRTDPGPDPFARVTAKNLVLFRVRNASKTGKGAGTKGMGLHALANPGSFRESVAPQYARRPVLGLSHEVVQYIRTGSREISMELFVSYHLFLAKGWNSKSIKPLQYRNFFEGLTVPAGERRAPPRVEVTWPKAGLAFVGVVTQLDIEYQRFNRDGYPLEYTLDISFVEVARRLRVTDKVMQEGMGYNAETGV